MADEKHTITIDCDVCKRTYEIVVPVEGLEKWHNGALIQDALPTLSVDQRELLISGTCGKCFDKMFPKPHD